MFPTLLIFILLGFPVAFTLSGTALLFAFLGWYADIFLLSDFGFIIAKTFGVIQNVTLIAVPLFIYMGVMLERSGIAHRLLITAEYLFRKINGGLPVALVLVGALLAASTGIVGATVVTMGVLSLPTLLERGYDKRLSCGTIVASGTLGQIIPPSIVLVLLGDMMNIDVARLFAGALVPGVILVVCYALYVFVRVSFNPALGPETTLEASTKAPTTGEIISSLLYPLFLMILVMGSILFGFATPTESAACGAFGAVLLTAIQKKLSWSLLVEVAEKTTMMTTMVFTLLVGAQVFSVVFRGLYGDELLTDFIIDLELSASMILFVVLGLMFILGFFLDFIEICFIIVPLLGPILTQEFNMHPIWVSILFAVNLQTSFLTPPFGFALFYLKGVCPREVETTDIFLGVLPFVLLQLLVLGLLIMLPSLVTATPDYFFASG